MRLIERIVRAIAQMFRLAEEGDLGAAMHAADQAYDALGVPKELVKMMDTAGLADLLAQPAKMRLTARLLKAEGDLLKAHGDPMNAAGCHRQALELLLEARLRAGPSSAAAAADDDSSPKRAAEAAEAEAEFRELVALVPQSQLASRYRA